MTIPEPRHTPLSSMRILVTFAASVALAACEHPGPGATPHDPVGAPQSLLVMEAPQYSPGSAIEFRLVNRTGRAVGYNLCRSRLERRSSDGDWELALPSLAEFCTAELRTLRPGASVRYTFKAPNTLRQGQYRVSTHLEDLGAQRRLVAVSNSFSISRDE